MTDTVEFTESYWPHNGHAIEHPEVSELVRLCLGKSLTIEHVVPTSYDMPRMARPYVEDAVLPLSDWITSGSRTLPVFVPQHATCDMCRLFGRSTHPLPTGDLRALLIAAGGTLAVILMCPDDVTDLESATSPQVIWVDVHAV